MTKQNQNAEPRVENRRLSDLKPFPEQEKYFTDMTDQQLADVADDISRNGLKEMIEILPDGTIVSGHQRVQAREKLGLEEVEVQVRYDLESASPGEVKRAFLGPNIFRRHL